jgi:carbon storage regulator
MSNLVLSRKVGETIVLNESITITFLANDSGQIRVSIEAPRDVVIRRGELGARQVDQALGKQLAKPHADVPSVPNVTIRQRKVKHEPDAS